MRDIEKKIIILLLIIIIFLIILFLSTDKMGVINVDAEIPTGNVDIFDITIAEKDNTCNCCNCSGICDENCACNSNPTSGENLNGCQSPCINNIEIRDEQIKYTNDTPLNIFSHQSYYIADGVIAPGSQNTYQFIIRNNNDFGIKYNLKIEEENPYNVNMRYRLNVNGNKVVGDEDTWVTAEELLQKEVVLANEAYNVYSLEWKWFESLNDTEIGSEIEANYELNISFFANRF